MASSISPSSRMTRSSVLGKRPHRPPVESASCDVTQNLPTPDPTPNPKRVRTSPTVIDGDANKENIPPFIGQVFNTPPSTRTTRSLRRASTEGSPSPHSRHFIRRHASTSNVQLSATSPSHASLPTPPSALLPIHVRARALLRPTCNNAIDIAGRAVERQAVADFIASFLNLTKPSSDEPSCLYISGSPGTGKTALVNAVIRALDNDLQTNKVKVMLVNCMALNSVDAVWVRLLEELDIPQKGKTTRKGRKGKEAPSQTVERLIAGCKFKCIIMLDELDHVASSSPALSSLFTLAETYSSHLRLIGIANTHTLTSSCSTAFTLQSLTSVRTLHFAPYTPQQLLEILNARLSPLSPSEDSDSTGAKNFLPVPTLTLLTKKVAAQTGDVRAVFEVLRGAIDLAVMSTSSMDMSTAPVPSVTPSHILSALKAYAPAGTPARSMSLPTPAATPVASKKTGDNETVTKVRELGLHSRLLLLTMLLASRRLEAGLTVSGSSASGLPSSRSPVKRSQTFATLPMATIKTSMDITQLYAYYSALLTRAEHAVFTPVSRSEFGDLAGVLEVIGLVSLSSVSLPGTPTKSGRKGLTRSASFGGTKNVGQEVYFVLDLRLDEVARGLGISDMGAGPSADVREEEVRALWNREVVRISREAKAQAGRPDVEDVFDQAMED